MSIPNQWLGIPVHHDEILIVLMFEERKLNLIFYDAKLYRDTDYYEHSTFSDVKKTLLSKGLAKRPYISSYLNLKHMSVVHNNNSVWWNTKCLKLQCCI